MDLNQLQKGMIESMKIFNDPTDRRFYLVAGPYEFYITRGEFKNIEVHKPANTKNAKKSFLKKETELLEQNNFQHSYGKIPLMYRFR